MLVCLRSGIHDLVNFWARVEEASGFAGVFVWLTVLFLVATAVVFHVRKNERARVRSAFVLFLLSFAGLLGAAAALTYGVSDKHWIYVILRGASSFLMAVAVVNVTSVFAFSIVLRSVRLEPPHIAQDLLLALVYAAIALAVLSHSGVDLRGIVATSAVLTAVIGFSLQDSLGNVFGGTVLQLERSIRVGDWIRTDDMEGRVASIRWRQTSIETRNGDTIVVPNGFLAKSKVTLLGRRFGGTAQRRQWVHFQVGLQHRPTRVIEIIETALRADPIPFVADAPPIHCLVTDLKNGDGFYAVRFWLKDLTQTDLSESAVRTRIYAALGRAGLQLASPTQSILITEEKVHRERIQSQEMDQRLTLLQKVDLFRALSDEELREIANNLINAPFVRGEAMTRQGAQANWLYLLSEGEGEVRVANEGMTQTVATLRAGDYFGEMGLMTGEPRSATVVALTPVKCYRLGREAFKPFFASGRKLPKKSRLSWPVEGSVLTRPAEGPAKKPPAKILSERKRRSSSVSASFSCSRKLPERIA